MCSRVLQLFQYGMFYRFSYLILHTLCIPQADLAHSKCFQVGTQTKPQWLSGAKNKRCMKLSVENKDKLSRFTT